MKRETVKLQEWTHGRSAINESVVDSGKHLADSVTIDVGQSSFESIMIKAQTLVIQAHQMKDRGIEIIN